MRERGGRSIIIARRIQPSHPIPRTGDGGDGLPDLHLAGAGSLVEQESLCVVVECDRVVSDVYTYALGCRCTSRRSITNPIPRPPNQPPHQQPTAAATATATATAEAAPTCLGWWWWGAPLAWPPPIIRRCACACSCGRASASLRAAPRSEENILSCAACLCVLGGWAWHGVSRCEGCGLCWGSSNRSAPGDRSIDDGAGVDTTRARVRDDSVKEP